MTTLIVFALLAAGAGLLLHRDMRRADERRRRRLIMAHPLVVELTADVVRMRQQIARATPKALWIEVARERMSAEKLHRAIGYPWRCLWCRVLAALGLSHHAAHYRPRHRAATR